MKKHDVLVPRLRSCIDLVSLCVSCPSLSVQESSTSGLFRSSVWSELFSVNVLGTLRVMHAFLPLLEISNSPRGPPSLCEGRRRRRGLNLSAPEAKSPRDLSGSLLSTGLFRHAFHSWMRSLVSYLSLLLGRRKASPSPSSASPCCRPRSRLILMGSILGRVKAEAVPGQTAYSASKAAVQVIAEMSREVLKKRGVHVSLVGQC